MNKINIIGAGLAGISAAITLAEKNYECRLISAASSERAQSVMAEGGINAALDTMGENDDPIQHFQDTMKGGVYLADPNAVYELCINAPDIVKHLCSIGAALRIKDKQPILRNFGGQKKKRTAYAKSSTGKILMSALIDEARKYEVSGLIQRYPHHELCSLHIDNGICRGISIIDIYTNAAIDLDGQTILCTGGMNSLFSGMTTGTTINTGDVTAEAFYKGAELANLEFIQYHPTTISIPQKRCLISEAARGEGGRLFTVINNKRSYFMEEKYPELGNLMPRDVVSREIAKAKQLKNGCGRVYLDMTVIDEESWKNKLSDLRDECIDFLNTDPMKEPVEVSPGIHYFMGGINVDKKHRTNIKGLYAAGECACQYHGANRLGGNSMLGALYGGKKAAESAVELINEGCFAITDKIQNTCSSYINDQDYTIDKHTAEILKNALGIFRNEKKLSSAYDTLSNLCERRTLSERHKKRLVLARAMLLSALNRRESRGSHTREDYPDKNDEKFLKTSIASLNGNNIEITLRDIPEMRGNANEV